MEVQQLDLFPGYSTAGVILEHRIIILLLAVGVFMTAKINSYWRKVSPGFR